MLTHRVLERVRMPSPTGYQFLDGATDAVVSDGLEVEAFSSPEPWVRVMGTPNPSGVFLFAQLPNGPVTVKVVDPLGRFLPLYFDAASVSSGGSVRLFSAPQRPVMNGLATVRALLRDAETGVPGAWAKLSVTRGGHTSTGLSDRKGSVVVVLPYPEPTSFGVTSLSGAATVPLTSQTWALSVSVRYRRWASTDEIPAVPLRADIEALAPGRLWARFTSVTVNTPFPDAALEYGRELVLRSQTAAGVDIPELLTTP